MVKGFTFVYNFEERKKRADLIHLMWLHCSQDAVIERELSDLEIKRFI